MGKIIFREGPLVFLRNVFVMEITLVVIEYGLSLLGNYELLYKTWGWDAFLRYDIFSGVVFSFFQIVCILLLFLTWYFSHYEINEKEIIRKSGLLFSRRKSVSLDNVVSVEVYQSPLSRIIHHATLILEHNNGRVTKLKNLGNFEECLHLIKQLLSAGRGKLRIHDVMTLLAEGESASVEFKETLRYDIRRGEVSREIERAVLKTIVGFLNATDGTLLVGVNDGGTVTGLDLDYKSLPKKNRDGLENHISMLLKTTIGLPFTKYVTVYFEKVSDKDVCIITVKQGHKPAYLRNNDKTEEFFARVGNSTQPFSMSEAEEYIKSHWK